MSHRNMKGISARRKKALLEAINLFEEHMTSSEILAADPQVGQMQLALLDKLKNKLEAGDLAEVVKILNMPEMMGPTGKAIFNASDPATDKIPVDKDGFVMCGDATPTQKNIFISQSVAWPLSDTDTANGCIKGDLAATPAGQAGYLTVNVAKSAGEGAKGMILDGHHRWSQTYSFHPNCKLPARVFDFGADAAQKALAKLQVAIRSELPEGEKIPKAGDKVGKRLKQMGVSDEDISKFQGNDNLLANKGNAEAMAAGIYQCALHPRELKSGNPLVLSDEWCQWALQNAAAACGLTGNETLIPAAQLTPGDRASIETCEVRSKVIAKVSQNLADNVPSPTAGAPDRTLMPQLDGGSLGNSGPDKIATDLDASNLNVNPDYYIKESIDLKRWNKLAGLLKD